MKIIRYQKWCGYPSVMLNLAFQPSQALAADSGVDATLPRSVQSAKSGDETHVAVNFSLANKVVLLHYLIQKLHFLENSAASVTNYHNFYPVLLCMES